MAFVVETGVGLVNATAYARIDQVIDYLTDRNRQAENSFSTLAENVQRAAVIAATDYIDQRFGLRFRGVREFRSIVQAFAGGTLTATANFLAGETVVIGDRTYTWVSTLTAANQVLIGADLAESLLNMAAAINGDTGEGITYGTGTVQHSLFSAETMATALTITARTAGRLGNDIALSETAAAAAWSQAATTSGADDKDAQALQFPRAALYTRDGQQVRGIPDDLVHATAEYAVRAAAARLAPDPTPDALGGAVLERRVRAGPVETQTRYESGSTGVSASSLRSYPEADRLLTPYLKPPGVSR